MPWIAVRTAAVLILSAAGMTGISILSACVTAAAVSRISGHRFTAESAVPAAAAAIIPVSVGISIHTHSPLFLILFCVHFILCTLPKIVPLFSCKQKRERICILSLLYYASRFASVVSSGFLFRISMNSSPVMVSFSSR